MFYSRKADPPQDCGGMSLERLAELLAGQQQLEDAIARATAAIQATTRRTDLDGRGIPLGWPYDPTAQLTGEPALPCTVSQPAQTWPGAGASTPHYQRVGESRYPSCSIATAPNRAGGFLPIHCSATAPSIDAEGTSAPEALPPSVWWLAAAALALGVLA